MNLKSIIKYSVSVIIAALLLFYAFKNVNLVDFISKASEVNYKWVILSVLLSLISHWLRAYRWNIMLSPFGYKLKSARTFLAVMTGYLANLAFPRLGEVTRCGVLKKNDGVPMSLSFGTVITERIVDFFILFFIIAANFFLEFEEIFGFFSETLGLERVFQNKFFIMLGAVILLIFGILGYFLLTAFLKNESDNAIINKVKSFVSDLMEGLFSLRKIENVYGFVFSTIGIWIMYYLMGYIIVFSIIETSGLGMLAGLSILVAGAIGMVVPVPGGTGAYHLTVSGILVIYGIQQETGLFFATLLHSSQWISYLVFGGLCVLISVFISKNKTSTSPQHAN